MGAYKTIELETRHIMPHVGEVLSQKGAREGDEFVLDIFQERKRTFKLNRTLYQIKFGDRFVFDFIRANITLPTLDFIKGEYQLELVNTQRANTQNNNSRYLFRTLDGNPFKLNGSYCFEAFIERGDILDLGFNRIHFPHLELKQNKEYGVSEKFIKSTIPILIEGETGTGKTTLAKFIHEESGRRGSFVHINLSAFSSTLIESELFGHVKGAFTGAVNSKKGAILEAHRGTLFLDEIDSVSLDLQTKLLLFLDNYEVRSVGGECSTKVDVRVIFASGSDLKKRLEDSLIRKDLYYRLKSGCSVYLKSLKSNPEKIREFCYQFEKNELVVMERSLVDFYSHCQWPGNIRQLKSHLHKKKILSNGTRLIFDDQDKELLAENVSTKKDNLSDLLTMEKMKIEYCYQVYLRMNKNMKRTKEALDISLNTLKLYINKWEEELGDNKVVQINL